MNCYRSYRKLAFIAVTHLLTNTFSAPTANAQLKGTHLLGDAGLEAGTQPPPSFSPIVACYDYHTTHFIEADGTKIDAPAINMFVLGVGGSVVTNVKILGAHYGASVLFALASSRVEGNLVSTHSTLAFTDTYIQPLQLGWTTKRADFSFGYAVYMPTGKYELGGNNNAGLGMWTNEFSAGGTVYFDAKKEWNFSGLFSYGFNSAKKNTGNNDIKVGNLLTIEGGLDKTWYCKTKSGPVPMVINTGIVYYMQFKTTSDQMNIPDLSGSTIDLRNKDRVYGLGAEANIFVPKLKSSFSLRWLTELGARNRTQGNTFMVTIAPYITFLPEKNSKPEKH